MTDFQTQSGIRGNRRSGKNIRFRNPGHQNIAAVHPVEIMNQIQRTVRSFRAVRIRNLFPRVKQKLSLIHI